MWNRRLRLWRRKRRDQEGAIDPASSIHREEENVLEVRASSRTVSWDLLRRIRSLFSFSVLSGRNAATPSAASGPSPSPFFSTRIQTLSEQRSDLGSEVEFEIEASKSTWTDTSVSTSNLDDEEQRAREAKQRVADSVAFEKLKEHPEWGPFFRRQPYELEIVGKIAEGGQAEIFEALGTNKHDIITYATKQEKRKLVVKVFKTGYFLEDLQRWWPAGLASVALPYRYFSRSRDGRNLFFGLCWSVSAQLLDGGRFAFVFDQYWGDFRKLIDKRMLERNGAPPFALWEAYSILKNIARGMVMLHKYGLLHKDLKAGNVLAVRERISGYSSSTGYAAYIADFESSAGIAGTGFWRAPEVLLALKNRTLVPETFTQQCDVYSYAMTCYEVLTGRIPFEGHNPNDYDIVLRGERPALPDDIYPAFKDLVRKCWHEDPLQRPSFEEIVVNLWAVSDDVEHQYLLTPGYYPLYPL